MGTGRRAQVAAQISQAVKAGGGLVAAAVAIACVALVVAAAALILASRARAPMAAGLAGA